MLLCFAKSVSHLSTNALYKTNIPLFYKQNSHLVFLRNVDERRNTHTCWLCRAQMAECTLTTAGTWTEKENTIVPVKHFRGRFLKAQWPKRFVLFLCTWGPSIIIPNIVFGQTKIRLHRESRTNATVGLIIFSGIFEKRVYECLS